MLPAVQVDGDTLQVYGKGGKERLVALGVAGSRVLAELPRNGHHVFPFQTSSIQDRFHRLSVRSGVHVHAHLLRHSCADRLRQAGVGIEDIGMILGHSDLSTTMRYLGRESERALEAQRRLNPCDALLGDGLLDGAKVLPFRRERWQGSARSPVGDGPSVVRSGRSCSPQLAAEPPLPPSGES